MSDIAKLYHFGATGVDEVKQSEWPTKRDGQHIAWNGSLVITTAYLNVGDIVVQTDGSNLWFVTVEGINAGNVATTSA